MPISKRGVAPSSSRELAEKIRILCVNQGMSKPLSTVDEIEALINRALEEAKKEECKALSDKFEITMATEVEVRARMIQEHTSERDKQIVLLKDLVKQIGANAKLVAERAIEENKEARSAALEEAAKIAETYWDHIPQEEFDDGFEIPKKDIPDFVHTDIAAKIRALQEK